MKFNYTVAFLTFIIGFVLVIFLSNIFNEHDTAIMLKGIILVLEYINCLTNSTKKESQEYFNINHYQELLKVNPDQAIVYLNTFQK
ncbi:hypothetical protein RJG79_07955 [Mycoplasmatota bacterium WC44]